MPLPAATHFIAGANEGDGCPAFAMPTMQGFFFRAGGSRSTPLFSASFAFAVSDSINRRSFGVVNYSAPLARVRRSVSS